MTWSDPEWSDLKRAARSKAMNAAKMHEGRIREPVTQTHIRGRSRPHTATFFSSVTVSWVTLKDRLLNWRTVDYTLWFAVLVLLPAKVSSRCLWTHSWNWWNGKCPQNFEKTGTGCASLEGRAVHLWLDRSGWTLMLVVVVLGLMSSVDGKPLTVVSYAA